MPDLSKIPIDDLRDAWLTLASTGTPPASEVAARVLPAWSVGIDGWLDRLTTTYLQSYCRRNSHFKLVVAPYGGGKTHFLLALAGRAAAENWAVCYLQCKAGVSVGDWFGLYEHIAKAVQLPNSEMTGIKSLAQAALDQMQQRAQQVPDPEAALDEIISALADENWPHSSFAGVMAALLNHLRDPRSNPQRGEAALRWLQGQPDTLTAQELQALHLQRVRSADRPEHGRTLFYSLARFIPKTGASGLVLLLDEMDTILNVRGKALERILNSMRVMLDAPDNRMERIPLFGVFAAVPDIVTEIISRKYEALRTRFQVITPFHAGSDPAPQMDLRELGNATDILRRIGEKLMDIGAKVHDWQLDTKIQIHNLSLLAEVTVKHHPEISPRRLFVKSWCGLLEEQARSKQHQCSEEALVDLIKGAYDSFKQADQATGEDIG